ncbi:MAG: hypothetical protein ACHREM_17390, partial [Polyangiales bacterium]
SPVIDAIVLGGPIGAPIALVEDPANPGDYEGSLPACTRVWEFSIERGSDHVKRVILLAPSFPSVQLSESADGLRVTWSPAHEEGVTSAVVVRHETPAAPNRYVPLPSQSVSSASDDGAAGPFAIPRLTVGDSYSIGVSLEHNYEFDWGGATLSTTGAAWLYGPEW